MRRRSLARRLAGTAGMAAALACVGGPHPGLVAPEREPGACRELAGTPTATVAWLVAADSADAVVLDRLCGEVGPAVVHQPDAPVTRPDSLAVVSWNLHIGSADLAGFVRDLRSGALTGGRPVRDFVILAQEARRGPRGDVVETARDLGLGVYYAPAVRNGDGAPGDDDRGNAILSTVPLDELELVELPPARQRRVALVATVHLGPAGVPLRLANVHLENRIGGVLPHEQRSVAGRRAQMAAFLRAARLDDPVVLAGDLNTWAYGTREPVIEDLVSRGFTFSPLPAYEPTLVALWGLYTGQLDYVFHRLPSGWDARTHRIGERYGSDHHPLLAWVRPGDATAPYPILGAAR